MNQPLASTGWIVLTTIVLVLALVPFDPQLSEWAQALPDEIVDFNRTITDVGTFAWMIYTSATLLLIAFVVRRASRRDTIRQRARTARNLSAYFLLTIGTASALVHGLKFLIGRARPELFADYGAYSLTPFTGDRLFESFPSGHSTAAGAFFGAFAMLKPELRPLFLILALLIGVSRVIVGAHYPSDVAAGLLLGLWVAMMVAFLFARRDWLFLLDTGGWPAPKATRPPPK
ncbi:phosphatidic acid phosphatase [Sinorhizobium fredii USDA 205]|uniref:Phosphatase PAP2 family protein n=1 Tax=Rhizobium fredii TaxID=380 RepID=A0A2A6LTI5_RHIFR|nr:phosphatase PAP2 family protein [Sinorhizobium fredii]ASY70918.1 Phosphatidylglycerophosphatase B [Sinorhizobium fredii CCBAU 83666]AWM26980.1 Phosphatidylglycerophosphatase B [Sinorhizobium fredii CCBAU 25509]KSV86496.1 phosphatidic acid phosphatase [Sinorhizobium fredii USDA 205]MCG5474545.1 phosphatase PAP2 family protein [Sinorhizobium fredii]MQW97675.1 phosphatase PAP2 family protein [Sinorhizobium fredii]